MCEAATLKRGHSLAFPSTLAASSLAPGYDWKMTREIIVGQTQKKSGDTHFITKSKFKKREENRSGRKAQHRKGNIAMAISPGGKREKTLLGQGLRGMQFL